MILAWAELPIGEIPQFLFFYNDACKPIFGNKFPPLGRKASLGEYHRSQLEPLYKKVIEDGQASWSEDHLLYLERHNYIEECYFTWSNGPILIEDGRVGGVLTPFMETTKRILGARRLQTEELLGIETIKGHSGKETCELAASVFGQNSADLPFSLIYTVDHQEKEKLVLQATSHLDRGSVVAPDEILLKEKKTDSIWPISVALSRNCAIDVRGLNVFGKLPGGPHPESPTEAVVIPFHFSGEFPQLAGVLIVGINPRKHLDDEYREWIRAVARQLGEAISRVTVFEEECHRSKALVDLDRIKTTFFNNVSHEFRTPLTMMLAPLEESLEDKDQLLGPRQRERQLLIQRNTFRLLKMVNCILDFSSIDAGKIKPHPEHVDISQLTTDLASFFRAAAEKAGLEFIVDVEPMGPIFLDPDIWEKILFNLLSNSQIHAEWEDRGLFKEEESPTRVKGF